MSHFGFPDFRDQESLGHKIAAIEFHAIDRELLAALAARLDRERLEEWAGAGIAVRVPMELVYIVALAILALLGGLLAARLLRQSRIAENSAKESNEHAQQAEADINSLRMAKLEVEQRLAIEEQKSARIPEFEKALTAAAGRIEQSRQARVAAESETAVAHDLDKQFCAIGSAKSNIGHLEAAAGIAGVYGNPWW